MISKLCRPQSLLLYAAGSLLVMCVSTSSVLGIIRRDDVPDSTYQALAALPQYASVGELNLPPSSGSEASGTLIASQYVLTASHNIRDNSGNVLPSVDFSFTIGGSTYNVTQISVAPGYQSGSNFNDLAVLKLSAPVANVTPATLYNASTQGSELGATGTGVGYGYGGTGTTGFDRSTLHLKRAGTNVVDDFGYPDPTNAGNINVGTTDGSNRSLLVFDFDEPGTPPDPQPGENKTGSATPTADEFSYSFGDSGGGLFETINGTTYLVGINEAAGNGVYPLASPALFTYGSVQVATRVSSYSAFIASSIPEPGTLTLLAGAAGLLVLRRPRTGHLFIGEHPSSE